MSLTQKIVDSALYEGRSHMSKGGRKRWSQHVLWDKRLPGLGVRITPTNRKSFVVSYRQGGRKRTKTLGGADKLTLKKARVLAAELLQSVTTESTESPEPEAAAAQGIDTVARLSDAYLEEYLKANVPSWYADERLIRTHVKPALGRSSLEEVTATDLASLSRRVARRFPADARRLRELLAGMFEWAAKRGLWSRSSRPAKAPRSAPEPAATAAEPGDAAERTDEPESAPEPPATEEELALSLLRSEEQRQALAARLDELSTGGAEMLAKINQQATRQRELERELRESQRELEQRIAEDEERPDPLKAGKQIANLQQSVEQLMSSLEEAQGERDDLAARLAAAEAAAQSESERVAALVQNRSELEDRVREEERKAAIRKVQRRPEDEKPRGLMWLAAGLVGGILLTLTLGSLLGGGGSEGAESPPETVADQPEPAAAEPGLATMPAATEAGQTTTAGEPEPDFDTAARTVEGWATAWSEQRVDDYLATYSVDFLPPDGLERDAWAAQRRTRIRRPSWIRVATGPMRRQVLARDRLEVSFAQSYQTATYTDQVLKTLLLVWEDGDWKIAAERSG